MTLDASTRADLRRGDADARAVLADWYEERGIVEARWPLVKRTATSPTTYTTADAANADATTNAAAANATAIADAATANATANAANATADANATYTTNAAANADDKGCVTMIPGTYIIQWRGTYDRLVTAVADVTIVGDWIVLATGYRLVWTIGYRRLESLAAEGPKGDHVLDPPSPMRRVMPAGMILALSIEGESLAIWREFLPGGAK